MSTDRAGAFAVCGGLAAALAAACAPPAGPHLDHAKAARALRAGAAGSSPAARLAAARALWEAGQISSATRRYLDLLLGGLAGEAAVEAAERVAADPGLPVEGERLGELTDRELLGLPDEVRGRLLHRVALELLRLGENGRAERALARTPAGASARFLTAVVRLRRGDRRGARAQFEEAERVGAGAQAELARLALARLDADEGRLDEAARRYAAVRPDSPAFFRARQELAWVELERGAPGLALAQSVVLQGPTWRRFHRPDRELVEAMALSALCREAAARIRARVGARRLEAELAQLATFLRERTDVRLYYVEATASAAGRGPLSRELSAALLADASFNRAFRVVRQIQRERRMLMAGQAGPLRELLERELEARLVLAQQRAGELTRRLAAELRAELSELRLRLEELVFDLDSIAEQFLVARRSGQRAAGAAIAAGGRPGDAAAGSKQRWPLEGEHWLDEQGDLVVQLSSSCPSGPPLRPARATRAAGTRRDQPNE